MFTYINTLQAATPSSPENLISWKLKSIATIEEDVLERSSENPFEALRFISLQSSFVFVKWSLLFFANEKYMGNGRISAKQSEILEYIKEEVINKGYPPAVQ